MVHRPAALLAPRRPSRTAGLVAAIAGVAAITGIIFGLKHVAPVDSTGVLYLLAVLAISAYWGLSLGLLTALASALAFNFFHLPPTGALVIARSGDWVALIVFAIAAVLASTVAQSARSKALEAELRRQEADLGADLASLLLGPGSLAERLPRAAERLGEALGTPASIVLGPDGDGPLAVPLAWEGRRLGTLRLEHELDAETLERTRRRIVPQLEALLAATLTRDELQADAVEAQALRRSDVLKTALLRAVSHDLRSPLTTIVAAAEVLGSPAAGGEDRAELAQAITDEGLRLTQLVDKLLDLSRLQAGSAEPRRDWISIEEVVRAAADHVPSPGGYRFSIDAGLPLLRADAAQLERAIANLLENAVRFSAPHEVSIRAREVRGRVVVRVVDRGPGIPAADLRHVFEAFYRAADQPGRHPGSGLGLAIVKGFVEANQGRVRAESTPGQGTVFVLELPVPADAPRLEPALP